MAVTRDATGAGGTTTGAACTASHTCAVSNVSTIVLALVAISVSSNSTATTCSATYGGVAMTQHALVLLGSSTNRSAYGIYYLFNPGTGAKNCVVTPAGASTKAGVRVSTVSYTGVGHIHSLQSAAALSLSTGSALDGYNIFGHINGVTMTSPNQSQRVLLGASVGGVGDFLLVQDAVGTGGNITFSVGGTATTPSTFGVALSPPAKIDTLTDPFVAKDTALWNWTAPADVVSGQAQLPANVSYGAAIDSLGKYLYDLTASSFALQAAQMPNLGNGTTEASAELRLNSTNKLCFIYSGGNLLFRETVGGTNTDVTVTYSATTHKWWRFRESGGTIYWETSSDGRTWITQRSKTPGIGITSFYVILNSGYYGTEPSPGTAIFDNINLLPGPPISGVVDRFTSVSLDPQWNPDSTGTLSGGAYYLTPGNALITADVWDMTNGQLKFDIVSVAGSTTKGFLGVATEDQQLVYVFYWSGAGAVVALDGTVPAGTTAAWDVADRHFRIRHSSGTIYWERSTDNSTWTVMHSTTTAPGTWHRMMPYFGAAADSVGNIAFDNVNFDLPPTQPIAALVEDFNSEIASGIPDPAIWDAMQVVAGAGSVVVNSSGALVLTADPGPTVAYIGLPTLGTYDLTGSQVIFQLATGTTLPDSCQAIVGDPNYWCWLFAGTATGITAGDGTAVPITVTPGMWFRLRESAGTVYYEYSSNGTSWTAYANYPSSGSTLVFTFGPVVYDETTLGGSIAIDNINVPPSAGTPVSVGFTGGGTLSSAAAASYSRSISLAGSGTLSATRSQIYANAPPLSGSGSLAATAGVGCSATLAGSGALSATAVAGISATLAGSGALSATFVPKIPSSLTSDGVLSSTATQSFGKAAGLAGDGALSSTTLQIVPARPDPFGEGELTSTARASYSRAGGLIGPGVLSGVLNPIVPAPAGLSSSGALSGVAYTSGTVPGFLAGAGALSASVLPMVPKAAGLTGAGALSATAVIRLPEQATVAWTGDGSLSAVTKQVAPMTVGLSGSGSLVGFLPITFPTGGAPGGGWTVEPPTPTPVVRAGWVTTPTTTSTLPKQGWLGLGTGQIAARTLAGSGQLVVATLTRPFVEALEAGDGELFADLLKREFRTTALAGNGELRFDYSQILPAAPQFNGNAFLFGDTVSTHLEPVFSGGGLLEGRTDGLTAIAVPGYSLDAGFSGDGNFVSFFTEIHLLFAQFAGAGTLTGPLVPKLMANLAGSGALSAPAFALYVRTAALLASGTLSATTLINYLRSIGFAGAGDLTALFQAGLAAYPGGSGTIGATVSQVYSPTPALSGAGTLSATAGLPVIPPLAGGGALSAVLDAGHHFIDTFDRTVQNRVVMLAGAGALSATAIRQHPMSAALSGGGTLTPIALSIAAFDSVGAGKAASGANQSWSHVIGANAKAVIVATSYIAVGGAVTPTAKVGSTNMTLLGSVDYTETYYEGLFLFGLLNPPTGSQTITVTWSGNGYYAANSVAYLNVSSFGTVVTNRDISASGTTAMSLTVPSAVGQMVAQAFASNNYATSIGSYNQTQRYKVNYGSSTNVATLIGDAPGAASVPFTATLSSTADNWGAIGVPLVP